MNPDRTWVGAGAVLLALGIACGAFGAHALRDSVAPEKLEVYKTGVHYHQLGSLAIMVIAAASPQRWPLRLLTAGTLIFALTLYGYTVFGIRWFAMITPVGGALMILACLWAGLSCFGRRER